MLPVIVIREIVKEKAAFSDDLTVSGIETASGFRYAVSDRQGYEKSGRFFVSGTISGGAIKGLISVGAVNGQEARNGDASISENPSISGSGPYVCLRLTPEPITASVVCNPTFGVQGDEYYHPLALFKMTGKVAQFAYFDYNYKPVKKGGKWIHLVTPA